MKSIDIWRNRYSNDEFSGLGSRGDLLKFKVDFINEFIEEEEVKSILDFGYGDLHVALQLDIDEYRGIDIFDPKDDHGLTLINSRFDEYDGPSSDVVLCLDVLYHILEDEQDYMRRSLDKMIEKADKFLIIYAQDSTNTGRFDREYTAHLYNSKWLQYMQEQTNFELTYQQDEPFDGSSAQFFVFEKITNG
jgi:hypothetical protein